MCEPCISRHALIEFNITELNFCIFIISLDLCNGSYNAFDHLYTKIYVASETNDVNVKVFNMIERKNKIKTLVNVFLVILNVNLIVQLVTEIKGGIMINVKCKKYLTCRKDYSWNPSTYICENSRYIKSAVDNSVAYDKVISVMNRVSTDVTSTVLINFDNKDKKVRYKMDFYILYTFLLVAI